MHSSSHLCSHALVISGCKLGSLGLLQSLVKASLQLALEIALSMNQRALDVLLTLAITDTPQQCPNHLIQPSCSFHYNIDVFPTAHIPSVCNVPWQNIKMHANSTRSNLLKTSLLWRSLLNWGWGCHLDTSKNLQLRHHMVWLLGGVQLVCQHAGRGAEEEESMPGGR